MSNGLALSSAAKLLSLRSQHSRGCPEAAPLYTPGVHKGPVTAWSLEAAQQGVMIVTPFNTSSSSSPCFLRRRGGVRAMAASAPPAAVKTTPFAHVKTKSELLGLISKCGLPERAAQGMEEFFESYLGAILSSGVPDPEAVAVRVMGTVFDRIMLQFTDPYTFPSHHQSLREPYDYYNFGQNYVRPLIDYSNSYVGNVAIFKQIADQVARGDNVVLLANHQTEADPAVLALMLEHGTPSLATAVTYVAGDRVVLDPFCKPFSMGRHLLCVHSKKRIHDVPELAEQKLAANRRTLKEMASLFKKGGNFIWVAPSGGRDRPDPATDQWVPAEFDASAVELMRRLGDDSGRPSYLYPLAMLCFDIMPPPRSVEKALGEKRIIGYSGVAISVGPAVDFQGVTAGIQGRREAGQAYSQAVFDSVKEQYNVLFYAIHGGKGLSASTSNVNLSQPWTL